MSCHSAKAGADLSLLEPNTLGVRRSLWVHVVVEEYTGTDAIVTPG